MCLAQVSVQNMGNVQHVTVDTIIILPFKHEETGVQFRLGNFVDEEQQIRDAFGIHNQAVLFKLPHL